MVSEQSNERVRAIREHLAAAFPGVDVTVRQEHDGHLIVGGDDEWVLTVCHTTEGAKTWSGVGTQHERVYLAIKHPMRGNARHTFEAAYNRPLNMVSVCKRALSLVQSDADGRIEHRRRQADECAFKNAIAEWAQAHGKAVGYSGMLRFDHASIEIPWREQLARVRARVACVRLGLDMAATATIEFDVTDLSDVGAACDWLAAMTAPEGEVTHGTT